MQYQIYDLRKRNDTDFFCCILTSILNSEFRFQIYYYTYNKLRKSALP